MIEKLIDRARFAQRSFEEGAEQNRLDRACDAVAWALLEPKRNAELSALAVAETGLGNVRDKVVKNHRKTLGLLRDLRGQISFGKVSSDSVSGITEYLRPKGVVAAIVPSTNPLATPTNNIINAIKTANAIILAPSPKGIKPLLKLVDYIHAEFARLGMPAEWHDLVQVVPSPPSKAKTTALMRQADFVVVTGSQNNVRAGYESGTPAIGVGVGNVAVIVDETADLADAAEKIARSKCFDNATSCSSENALLVVDAVYDAFVQALAKVGGMLLNDAQTERLVRAHWQDGALNRNLLAQDINVVLDALQLTDDAPANTRFLLAPTNKIGLKYPLCTEKMALFAALYRADDFADAKAKAAKIYAIQGRGHSLGLHTREPERAHELAMQMQACRIIVNQAHCFATGGAFDNGLPFSLSMGCGSWGGNSIDDNLNWRHFVNRVRVVQRIDAVEPDINEIFADYRRAVGDEAHH